MTAPARRLPSAFRGEALEGDGASERASRVSGPFTADPDLYAAPRDVEDLQVLVRWAREEGLPIVPRGAGTGMPGGNLGAGIVVDLSPGFAGVDPADPERRTLRAGAGAVADRVQEEAARAGFRLPALPASSRWCTVGGMAANNAAGARSFRHGSMARWIAALEGVDARGDRFRVETAKGEGRTDAASEVFRSLDPGLSPEPDGLPPGWPRVRKNSSGYALDRFLPDRDPVQLLVGSEGTLVLVTSVELRLIPEPPFRGLVVHRADGPRELQELSREAARLQTVTCEFLGRRLLEMAELTRDPEVGPLAEDAYALVLLEVEGTRDEVEGSLEPVAGMRGKEHPPPLSTTDPEVMTRLWSLRHRASPLISREAERGRISTQFIEDSVVPPDRLADYLVGTQEILEGHGFDAVMFGHAGDGNVHVNPLVDVGSPDWEARVRGTLDEVAALVAGLAGTLSGEHGDGRLRAPLLSRIWPPHLVEAFGRVKEALDPEGILNPGVILPLPGQDPLSHFRPRPRAFP